MGNTQPGPGGIRNDAVGQRPGSSRRNRMMSDTARFAAEVLPLPDGPPMLTEDPPESGNSSRAGECPVVFRWSFGTTNQPRQVSIIGSWDGWGKKIPMVKSTTDFTTIVDLEPGEYEYKFMVDGQWVVDDNQKKKSNAMGSENNVIHIQEADFAVFEALEQDFHSSNAGEVLRGGADSKPSHDTPNDRELEKLRSFSQEIPSLESLRKAPGPPWIPPQLLQVLLNKEIPEACDPNVLPEPNHVMLNHMYALSIKDSVMVLSSTQRYRKKKSRF
ncbi:unnamed protein product [Caenorhabditis auriculariae]|uniref:Association with the SNF1 complex (ASC) domain-containing protein n=1 Tax=Caenorhabditis auriculariae TaxID=2777116 RepID=A0A8S1GW22_9PELO|nr:unnamed protein product [Caenorhabditis auriculariae]